MRTFNFMQKQIKQTKTPTTILFHFAALQNKEYNLIAHLWITFHNFLNHSFFFVWVQPQCSELSLLKRYCTNLFFYAISIGIVSPSIGMRVLLYIVAWGAIFVLLGSVYHLPRIFFVFHCHWCEVW